MSARPAFRHALRVAAIARCRDVGESGRDARSGSGANSYGWK